MKYHLIGDQGVSMRGIKKYLQNSGHTVTGSDLKSNGHKYENITPDIDVVVRTSAVNLGSAGWVEVEAAKDLKIKITKRSEIIGEITKDKKLIAISGMHGKTTTTSMIGLTMIAAGLDPTVLIGEELKDFQNDVLRMGKSDWFVLEACEYDRSFLDFYPKILILTNIEEEHLDTYPGGLEEIKEAFIEYVNHIPEDGLIIACGDDKNVREVIEASQTKAQVIYYGFTTEKYHKLSFNLFLPGKHNILNALSVVALADYLEIDQNIVESVLSKFSGAHRRFEYLGICCGADLIDDYGHHPTEIQSTINALSEKYPTQRKIVVFWPHQYKRVASLLKEFGECFSGADEVIVKPIFYVPGRDEVLPVSSKDIANGIEKMGITASCMETDEEIVSYLKGRLDENSVLLTIGIPPVYKVILKILEDQG